MHQNLDGVGQLAVPEHERSEPAEPEQTQPGHWTDAEAVYAVDVVDVVCVLHVVYVVYVVL